MRWKKASVPAMVAMSHAWATTRSAVIPPMSTESTTKRRVVRAWRRSHGCERPGPVGRGGGRPSRHLRLCAHRVLSSGSGYEVYPASPRARHRDVRRRAPPRCLGRTGSGENQLPSSNPRAGSLDRSLRLVAGFRPAATSCSLEYRPALALLAPGGPDGRGDAQPYGVMLLGEPWVLHRAGGHVVAFADRCPHRHTPLSLGHCEAGVLQCASPAGASTPRALHRVPALGPGAPSARGPARTAVGVIEAYGIVFLAPEEPITPLGSLPEAGDPSFKVGELPTLRARGNAGLLADNFLDMAHFPFVHAGTFGAGEAAEVPPLRRCPRRLVLHHVLSASVRQPGRPWRSGGAPAAGCRPAACPTA